jgi:hypothetical protein
MVRAFDIERKRDELIKKSASCSLGSGHDLESRRRRRAHYHFASHSCSSMDRASGLGSCARTCV